ncbi:hypothetical protein MKW94_004795 [Papaver nudicaule]|uniref:Uncharacterized protein n=1 Tax=Papaver nudicaule TaxID=74823 RepID=A0AA41VSE2_PAPNU|nr:hypothetical protein [Papaver nudicaule]
MGGKRKSSRGPNGGADEQAESLPEKKTRKKGKSKDKINPEPPKETGTLENDDSKKRSSTRPFRAGFGLLHDLFKDNKDKENLVLNDEQRKVLKKTPFWNLLQVFINNQFTTSELEKPLAGLKKLTESYRKSEDGKRGFLVREGDEFQPTPEELALVFGLQIVENVFFTRSGGWKLPCRYLVLVESIELINSISWPHLIHKHTMDSIHNSNGVCTKIDGCAFYLLYWYAERSNAKSMTPRDECKGCFPRFARWSTKEISHAIADLESSSFEDIKQNFGSKVEDLVDEEKTLVTPKYVKSQIEKLMEEIGELKEKQNAIEKLCEIKKCSSENPETIEVVQKILNVYKQDKVQPHGEQENQDSDPQKDQEHTLGQQKQQENTLEDEYNSSFSSAQDPNLRQPTKQNEAPRHQQVLEQYSESGSDTAAQDPNLGQPTQKDKEAQISVENKEKEEEEEQKKQEQVEKKLAEKKERQARKKMEEEQKARESAELRKKEDEAKEKHNLDRERIKEVVVRDLNKKIQSVKTFRCVLNRLGVTVPPRLSKSKVSRCQNIYLFF